MDLIKFHNNPDLFDETFNELFKAFPVRPNDFIVPAMDIYLDKSGKNLVVEMPLPGVNPDNVEILLDDQNYLTIKGKIEKKSEVDDKNYYRKETKVGSFYRKIALPLQIDSEKVKADYEDGVLKVVLPKIPEKKAKQIKIESKKSKK